MPIVDAQECDRIGSQLSMQATSHWQPRSRYGQTCVSRRMSATAEVQAPAVPLVQAQKSGGSLVTLVTEIGESAHDVGVGTGVAEREEQV